VKDDTKSSLNLSEEESQKSRRTISVKEENIQKEQKKKSNI